MYAKLSSKSIEITGDARAMRKLTALCSLSANYIVSSAVIPKETYVSEGRGRFMQIDNSYNPTLILSYLFIHSFIYLLHEKIRWDIHQIPD